MICREFREFHIALHRCGQGVGRVMRVWKNILSARSFLTADVHIRPVENSKAKPEVEIGDRPSRLVTRRSSILAARGPGAAVFVFRSPREVSNHP
jgi:hypothetical protein